MILREKQGLPPFKTKPPGLEAIPYSVFFDSVFELADAWLSAIGAFNSAPVNGC